MGRSLALLIRAVGAMFFALFGPACRFEPSCSRYAEAALDRHGVFTGLRLAIGRVVRCHPWHPGGYDPVR